MSDISDDDPRRESGIHELNLACVDLIVTIGLLGSVMERFPDEVQENFVDKVENLGILLREEIAEFHAFGEAYD